MAGQVGWKSETTWGTGVTPDVFVPVTNSSLDIDEGYLRPAGIRSGRRTRNPGQVGARTVTGTVDMELPNKSVAVLFKHLFGAVVTTGAGPYTHTYTPGPAVSKSLTLQTGITDAADTIQPFTATGVKPDAWNLSCNVGEFAMLSVDWTAKDVVTATGLAAASYVANLAPFTFVQGAISVNGTPVASANSVTFTFTKSLRADRHVLGSRYIREQLENEHWEVTSEISCDFDNLTLFNLAPAATQVASIFSFTSGSDSLTITTSGQVVGDPPSLTRMGLEDQTVRLEHSSSTTDAAAVTAVLVTTDVTAV